MSFSFGILEHFVKTWKKLNLGNKTENRKTCCERCGEMEAHVGRHFLYDESESGAGATKSAVMGRTIF